MTSRKWFAGFVATLLVGAAGCTYNGAGKSVSIAAGQAAVARHFSTSDSRLMNSATTVQGMAVGSGGSVYALANELVETKHYGPLDAVPGVDVNPGYTRGLAYLHDGSLAFGADGVVKTVSPDGNVSVLAGAAGTARKLGTALPTSAAAAVYHFSALPTPFGVRPDGSILIMVGDVVWSLKEGRLNQIYRLPDSVKSSQGDPTLGWEGAVDASGTVYLSGWIGNDYARLGRVVTVGRDGVTGRLSLPKKVSGLSGDPAAMKIWWLTGAEPDGLYVHAYDDSGDYILHIRSGAAEVVARYTGKDFATPNCSLARPVDALNLPCALPTAMAYQSHHLTMAGGANYILEIATR